MTFDYIAATMPLTSVETPIAVPAPTIPLQQEGGNGDARSSATDFLQIESIVLNLDASLRVHARAHFFSWTQGLLQSNPNPSEDQIRKGLEGNLCRCTGYTNIVRAVQSASKTMAAAAPAHDGVVTGGRV